jgi:hypothetical protein
MSDRKYRQRGYQDDDRDRQPRPQRPPSEGKPRERTPDAPRTPNLMASHQVIRCRNCATIVSPPVGTLSTCPKCRAALHSCVQCAHFDPGARFQCMQTIPAPVSPKDAGNDCTLFAPAVRVERQTSTTRPDEDPRKAFEDLFKL